MRGERRERRMGALRCGVLSCAVLSCAVRVRLCVSLRVCVCVFLLRAVVPFVCYAWVDASLSMPSSSTFSLSTKYYFKLSLLPDSVRIASFVLRIFVTYALLNISHHIIRFMFFTFAGCADGPCKFGSITGQPHVVLRALFL